MTREEFLDWWTYHQQLHPSIAEWSQKLDPNGRTEMLRAWYVRFQDYELADAREASLRMTTDLELSVPAYDRDKTAGHVLAGIRKVKAERTPREQPERFETAYNRPGELKKLWPLAEEVSRRVKAGEDRYAVVESLDVGGAEYKRDRFACLQCRDSGMALVYQSGTVRAFRQFGMDGLLRYPQFGILPCDCFRGDKFADEKHLRGPSKGKPKWKDRYSPDAWVWCECGDVMRASNVARLADFCERITERQQELRSSPGYETAFEEFA